MVQLMPKPAQPTLNGQHIRLEPLDETHREGLRAACDADIEVWSALYPIPMQGLHLDDWWRRVMHERDAGTLAPMIGLVGDRVAGCSCFYLDPANRRVEIGNTYWAPAHRGSGVNPEAKMLMLAHAFAPGGLYPDGANVVQFKVDAINTRSRAAVTKLGAHLDGIVRHDRITWTGRVRDTCVFSILAEEWPMVRDKLEARLIALASP
jgi:RimJ/RimL family protein N-acetyltransferase